MIGPRLPRARTLDRRSSGWVGIQSGPSSPDRRSGAYHRRAVPTRADDPHMAPLLLHRAVFA